MYYRDTLFNRPDGGRKGISKSQCNQELKVMAVVSYYTAGISLKLCSWYSCKEDSLLLFEKLWKYPVFSNCIFVWTWVFLTYLRQSRVSKHTECRRPGSQPLLLSSSTQWERLQKWNSDILVKFLMKIPL